MSTAWSHTTMVTGIPGAAVEPGGPDAKGSAVCEIFKWIIRII